MNFKKLLEDDYQARAKPLHAQMEKIEARLASFRIDPMAEEIKEAKIAVKKRRREEALACGDQELVANLEKEIEEISDELPLHSEEINRLNMERDEVQRQIDQAGEQTFRKVYPEIQEQTLEVWRQAIDAAERGWEALQEFEKEHGIKLSFYAHHGGLSPRGDKLLRKRLEEWVD